MMSQQTFSSWHPPAEHKYVLTAQHVPMQEGQLPITTSNSSAVGTLWPGIYASSAQQAIQMPPSQSSRASPLALVPSKRSSRLLNPSNSSPQHQKHQQQQQQQQHIMSCAVGLAKPLRPILTDQTPTEPYVEAAMPPLLPLLDAADFISEPAYFQVGSSGRSPNHVAAPLYTSCFRPSESQASGDFAFHICQAAPATLDPQQAPDCTPHPASLVVPFKAKDSYCQQPVPHPVVHSHYSIQSLHSSQDLISHDHAVSFGTHQTVSQASVDASLQQMSHGVQRPHVPHTPHDGCHKGRGPGEQPSSSALHMPVQSVTGTHAPLGEEQESTRADSAAIHAAAEGLNQGVWPKCYSSISTDSSPDPRPSQKRKRAYTEEEEAKVELRKARNRDAARKTRTKRLDTIATLSDQVQALTCTNRELTVQLQQASSKAEFRSQEAILLRDILIAHAQELTESENISDNVCSLAKHLLHLLSRNHHQDF